MDVTSFFNEKFRKCRHRRDRRCLWKWIPPCVSIVDDRRAWRAPRRRHRSACRISWRNRKRARSIGDTCPLAAPSNEESRPPIWTRGKASAPDRRSGMHFYEIEHFSRYFHVHTECIRILDSPWEASRRDSGARVFEMWYPVTSWDFLRGSVVPPSYYIFIITLYFVYYIYTFIILTL